MKVLSTCLLFISFLILFKVNTQIICSKNCLVCSDPLTCTTCAQGFFIDSLSLCKPCNPGCQTCTPPTANSMNGPICTTCLPNFTYNVDKNQCFVCDLNCLTCSTSPTNCTTCFQGFNIQISAGLPNKCARDPNCLNDRCIRCQPGSNVLCTGCKTGYFLRPDFTCQICPYPCGACTFDVNMAQIVQQFTIGVQTIEADVNLVNAYIAQVNDFLTRYVAYNQARALNPAANIADFLMGGNFTLLRDPVNLDLRGPDLSLKILQLQQYFGLFADQAFFNNLASIVQQNQTQIQTTVTAILQGDATQIQNLANLVNSLTTQLAPQNLLFLLYSQPLMKQYFNGTFDELISNITKISLDWSQGPALCSSCIQSFYFRSQISFCLPCQKQCLRCNQTDCLQCAQGHFVVNLNQCQRCQYPCIQCQNTPTTCTICAYPFKLQAGGFCSYCQAPCDQCSPSNNSQCVTCALPFSKWPNAQGQCFRCSQDVCNLCQSFNTSFCTDCLPQFTVVQGFCMSCPQNCLQCTSINGRMDCLQCKQRFILNTTTKSCQSCQLGCILCNPSNIGVCITCQKGLFRGEDGKCRLCPQVCLQCTNGDFCTVFKDNFIPFGGDFVKCRPGCSKCLNTNPQICLACEDRFVLQGNLCKKCAKGCENCTSADVNVCTQCSSSRYLLNNQCVQCPSSCLSCTSASVCTACSRGFILNGTSCVEVKLFCGKNCINCDLNNNNRCLNCDFGYVLAPNGKCVRCPSKCGASCDASNPIICTSCMIGQTRVNGTCIKCPPNCRSCSNGSCFECNQGHKLINNNSVLVCVKKCIYPCKNCNENQCLQCARNFTLNNGICQPDTVCGGNGCAFCQLGTFRDLVTNQCKKCLPNCASCNSQTACVVCSEGFYLNNQSCIACPEGSAQCFDSSVSLLCKPGYVLKALTFDSSDASLATYSSKCEPCISPCKQCMVTPSMCISCINDEYRLNGTNCMKKLVVGAHIKFDVQFETFLAQGKIEDIMNVLQNKIQCKLVNTYVSKGSTNVGIAGQPNAGTSQQSLSQTISSTIVNNEFGIPIIASSVGIYIEDVPLANGSEQKSKTGMIVGIVLGCVAFFIILGIIMYILYKRNKNNQVNESSQFNGTQHDISKNNEKQQKLEDHLHVELKQNNSQMQLDNTSNSNKQQKIMNEIDRE